MIFLKKSTKSEKLPQERKQTASGDRGIHVGEKLLRKIEQFLGSPNLRSWNFAKDFKAHLCVCIHNE